MRKILLATLLMLLMSGAALAMEKPRAIVITPEVSGGVCDCSDLGLFLSTTEFLTVARDLTVQDVLEINQFVVYDCDVASEQKLSFDEFVKQYNIQYLIRVDVSFIKANVFTKNGTDTCELQAGVNLSLIDIESREILFSTNTAGSTKRKHSDASYGTIIFDAISDAIKKATIELSRYCVANFP